MAGTTPSGETNLQTLLRSMSPDLIAGEFVFCSFAARRYGELSDLEPFAAVCEAEGLTLVLPRSQADRGGIPYESVFRCITLQVHSSLDAVGLTAAVSAALASEGISANVVAGYYHDHIFVQQESADDALLVLQALAR